MSGARYRVIKVQPNSIYKKVKNEKLSVSIAKEKSFIFDGFPSIFVRFALRSFILDCLRKTEEEL